VRFLLRLPSQGCWTQGSGDLLLTPVCDRFGLAVAHCCGKKSRPHASVRRSIDSPLTRKHRFPDPVSDSDKRLVTDLNNSSSRVILARDNHAFRQRVEAQYLHQPAMANVRILAHLKIERGDDLRSRCDIPTWSMRSDQAQLLSSRYPTLLVAFDILFLFPFLLLLALTKWTTVGYHILSVDNTRTI
jgi:hypothetical protein